MSETTKAFNDLLKELPENPNCYMGVDVTGVDLTPFYAISKGNWTQQSILNTMQIAWRPKAATIGDEYNGPYNLTSQGEKSIHWDAMDAWKRVRANVTIAQHLEEQEGDLRQAYLQVMQELESKGLSFDDLKAYHQLVSGLSVFGRLHITAVPNGYNEFGERIEPIR